MKVVALTTFGGQGIHVSKDDVFELPEGSDWLRAGLVAPFAVEPDEQEAAIAKPARKATRRKPRRRTRKK